MKPKHQRFFLISTGCFCLFLAFYLFISAFENALIFFYTPHQCIEHQIPLGSRIRLGGFVAEGSVQKQGLKVFFEITDFKKSFKVQYEGMLPDLFKEGQGVVAEGSLQSSGVFHAQRILAKHDENYKPPLPQGRNGNGDTHTDTGKHSDGDRDADREKKQQTKNQSGLVALKSPPERT